MNFSVVVLVLDQTIVSPVLDRTREDPWIYPGYTIAYNFVDLAYARKMQLKIN